MADSFVFANRGVAALQSAIDQFATQIYIGVDDVDRFPTLVGGSKFPIILSSREDEYEICYATALSGTGEMTVERAREGTAAQSWSAGTYVEHTFTVGSFLAAARLVPQGDWSAAENYGPGDVVVYTNISYIAVQPSLNQVPSPGSAYWQQLYQPPGVSSTALTWSGDWNSGTTYATGAYVKYRGRLWVAIAAGANHLPTDPTYWYALGVPPDPTFYDLPLAASGTNNYTVAPSPAPSALYDGLSLSIVFANTNTTPATLTVGALAPTPLRAKKSVEFDVGEIIPNVPYDFVYFSGSNEFVVKSAPVFEKKIADIVTLNSAQDARLAAIEAYKKYVPVGCGMDFWGPVASVPSGWLMCYGQAVSRVTYAALFTVIGTLHGVGDGTTTFNLPDKRDRVTAGLGNMGGAAANRLTNQTGGVEGDTVGAAGGAETHTLTIAQLATHDHPLTGNVTYTRFTNNGSEQVQAGSGGTVQNEGTNQSVAATDTLDVGNTGSDQPHNNVQPTIIAPYIIFTGV